MVLLKGVKKGSVSGVASVASNSYLKEHYLEYSLLNFIN